MSDDNGFVERPVAPTKRHGLLSGGVASRLLATARNGKAIVITQSEVGGASAVLKRRGYRPRTTKMGAPDGKVFAWAEKLTPATPPAASPDPSASGSQGGTR